MKRTFDLCFALLAVIFLSPVLIVTALIIYAQDGGNPIFVQKRVGKDGEFFKIFKFRSMPINAENIPSRHAHKLPITPFGKFIRRTNLDELPQLFNIVLGDMSIVGPRPAIPCQTELTELRKKGALSFKPGLTGWAQIHGFDGMSVEQKAKYDNEYAKKASLLMDISIILRTFAYLLKPPPVY